MENWKKNLTVLCISQFIYRAGTRSLIPFLPLFIQDLGKTSLNSTAIWSGWIFAAPFIVSFFATPFWGSFGDKYGRKLMTLFAVFGFAVSQFLMGISANLTQLLLFASWQEVMGGFYPAAVSLTASNTPKEKTAHALGLLQFANAAGNVTGPLIGGILADMFGYREVFFLIAGTVAVTGFLLLFLIEEKNFVQEGHIYHSLLQNWKYVIEKRTLIACAFFLLIYSLSVTIIRPTFALFVESLNLPLGNLSTVIGILIGVFGGTSAIASALVGKITEKRNLNTILLIASIGSAVTFLSFTVVSSLPFIFVILAIGGFSLGLMLPIVFTMVSNNTENERKAGVLGVNSSFQMIGNLGAAIASGYLVSNFGLRFPFAAGGLLFLFAVPIFTFSRKESK